MPQIRKPQWDALVKGFLLSRAGEIERLLRPSHAATFERLGKDEVRRFVEYGIAKACAYGIEDQAGATLLLHLMFTYGEDFDVERKTRWAGAILGQHDVPIRERLRDLDEQAQAVELARADGLIGDDEPEEEEEEEAEDQPIDEVRA